MRIHGCGGPNSGARLDAIPSLHHFTLSNDNIVNAICLRLGKAIPCLQSLDKCNTQCGQQMDIEGYHALACKWGVPSTGMTVFWIATLTCLSWLDFIAGKS